MERRLPGGGDVSVEAGRPRILHFPPDCSLGVIQVRDAGQEEVAWDSLGQARGDVAIPEGKEALLMIQEDTCDSLPLLKDLEAQ